jgi:8-oxo-dGTP pyrophosphatase MutT (NUDIX family)
MSSAPLETPTRPPIRDPKGVPVVGTDAHLPAIPAERLTASWLRERLERAHLAVPMIAGDGIRGQLGGEKAPAAASVLVPLVQRPGGLQVLLTRRTDHLRDHAGQISFPGGRAEPEDDDAVDTALREAQEEVGLSRRWVNVIGILPDYTTITRFVVTPVVGLVSPDYVLTLDPFEVAEAFEVPLAFLMAPAHHQRHEFEFEGSRRQFLSMPWTRDSAYPDEFYIWGATAAMLRNLYHLLND